MTADEAGGRPAGPTAPAAVWRSADRVATWLVYAGVGLLFATTAVTVLDIATRRSIGWSVPGLVDLSELLVMGGVFLVIPYTFLHEGNVDVDFATARLPVRLVHFIKACAGLLATALFAAFAWYSWTQAMQQIEAGDRSTTIAIPVGWYWAPLLVGCGAATVAAVLVALRYFRLAGGGTDLAGAPPGPLATDTAAA